jgi:hypothetical protein
MMFYKTKQVTNNKKILVGLATVLFLATYLLSLFMFTGLVNQASGDCPFMSHTEVVCSASPFGHIDEWQSAFTSIVPTQILTLIIFGALLFSVGLVFPAQNSFFNQNATRIPVLFRHIKAKLRTFFHRPFQELFAQGILHPKTF